MPQAPPRAVTDPPDSHALDAIATPALVLDQALRVHFANSAAQLLSGTPAAPLQLRRARGPHPATIATAAQPHHHARLLHLVRAATANGTAAPAPAGALRLAGPAGTPTLAALVIPLPGHGNLALLLLRALPPEPPPALLLRDLFGLTHAEAEMARALAGGATKAHVAAARGLRETTVRTHVRAVLEKTGTANLRELERLLAGLSPP